MTAPSLRGLLRPELADLTAYAPEPAPAGAVKLDANEAPPATSPAIQDAVMRAVGQIALERYPDPRMTALRAALARRTGARADDLLVGCGSDEVIALLLNALARPREKAAQSVVLSPTPTFVMYRVSARAHGWKSVEVPLDAAWDLDLGTTRRALDETRPSLVFVATPNNPTSNRVSADRLEALVRAAPGALVVVDEAYVDYAKDGSLRAWRERFPNLGILRTLSKIGLAALRIGWLEADAELVREIDKGRQPYNVSATSQAAATAVLDEAWDAVQADVARVVAERRRVAEALGRAAGLEVTPSDANFLWVRTEEPAGEVGARLAAHGVLVRSFHAAGGRLANQLRVTIGTPEENDRLLAFAWGRR